MNAIDLEHIGRRFGSTVALDDVSIQIADGEFLVLLGPSGCGKSTLLRIIAGLLEPTSGRVVIDNKDVTELSPGERDIAMVFQSYALYPHLSVERNLAFGLSVRRTPKAEIAERIAAVAGQLRLSALLQRRPRELSGGQRQRVALGRAMVRNPRAFLMDEPLSNLDAQLRTATRVELAELHRRLATTFVYVTHDQVEAMTMATRIVVMNEGRIEQIGTPAEVYDEPASAFVASFIGAPPMNLLPARALTLGGKARVLGDGIDIELGNGDLAERPVLLGLRPEHLRPLSDEGTGPRIAGRVQAIENLGSEEVAFVEVGGAQLAVRAPRPIGMRVGDSVTLTTSPERVYLFDPHSNRRLIWVDDERVALAGAAAHESRPLLP